MHWGSELVVSPGEVIIFGFGFELLRTTPYSPFHYSVSAKYVVILKTYGKCDLESFDILVLCRTLISSILQCCQQDKEVARNLTFSTKHRRSSK